MLAQRWRLKMCFCFFFPVEVGLTSRSSCFFDMKTYWFVASWTRDFRHVYQIYREWWSCGVRWVDFPGNHVENMLDFSEMIDQWSSLAVILLFLLWGRFKKFRGAFVVRKIESKRHEFQELQIPFWFHPLRKLTLTMEHQQFVHGKHIFNNNMVVGCPWSLPLVKTRMYHFISFPIPQPMANLQTFWGFYIISRKNLGGGFNSNIFGIFTPKIGEDEPMLTHIFQMGWWNHQPGISWPPKGWGQGISDGRRGYFPSSPRQAGSLCCWRWNLSADEAKEHFCEAKSIWRGGGFAAIF